MTITFCGHSDFCEAAETETALLDLLEDLIDEQSVEFFLGGAAVFGQSRTPVPTRKIIKIKGLIH